MTKWCKCKHMNGSHDLGRQVCMVWVGSSYNDRRGYCKCKHFRLSHEKRIRVFLTWLFI